MHIGEIIRLKVGAIYFKLKILERKRKKTPTIRWSPMSRHLVTVRRRNSLLTGRNIQEIQYQGGEESKLGERKETKLKAKDRKKKEL